MKRDRVCVCVCVCVCIINFQLSSECKKAMSEMIRILDCQKQIIIHFKLHGVLFKFSKEIHIFKFDL